MDKWYEGKKNAPAGTIPNVGEVGPSVKIQARDEAHAKDIEATGFYKLSSAPKVDAHAEATEQKPEAPTKPADTKKGSDK